VSAERRRHFSLIRDFHLADIFTLANGACGTAAIFLAMEHVRAARAGALYAAGLLVVLALVFDVLDGRVARWRHQASPLGRELDSLADVISFGVAPAAIAFAAGLHTLLDAIALTFFALCGLSRLARYNITAEALSVETGTVKYFEGTPIPTSVVPLGILMLAFHRGTLYPVRLLGFDFHLVTLVFVLSGMLMISKTLRIPKP
jgi:CDP-diacylglycerol--serine O-phosphatidyltransferase